MSIYIDVVSTEFFVKKQDIWRKSKIQKIILSLQNYKGKETLSGTVFISMMGMIKISIDISEMKILDFEKKSIMDMIKIIRK